MSFFLFYFSKISNILKYRHNPPKSSPPKTGSQTYPKSCVLPSNNKL